MVQPQGVRNKFKSMPRYMLQWGTSDGLLGMNGTTATETDRRRDRGIEGKERKREANKEIIKRTMRLGV